MDHKTPDTTVLQQVYQFLIKYGALLGWITLGLIGQFSYNLIRNKSMSYRYMAGCTGTALFVGYVGGVWVQANYPDKVPILIPILTLLSNNIISALMLINWKAIIARDWKGAFEILMKKK